MNNISLEQCPLFRGLSDEEISKLLPAGDYSHLKFTTGNIISRKDTAYSGLMIVVKGSVTGKVTSAAGCVMFTDEISAPNLISPAFLFGGYNRLPFDVVAATNEVEIVVLHRAKLFELMQDNVIILSNFIDILSNRANVLNKRLFYLAFVSLKHKICEYIIDETKINHPITKRSIMKYFDITLDSVEKILNTLVKAKTIALDGDNVTVVNREKLSKQ
ncbi:MAG: cyclic nucleotide-binding domain-containing protein [Rikenellaceae bacterium]